MCMSDPDLGGRSLFPGLSVHWTGAPRHRGHVSVAPGPVPQGPFHQCTQVSRARGTTDRGPRCTHNGALRPRKSAPNITRGSDGAGTFPVTGTALSPFGAPLGAPATQNPLLFGSGFWSLGAVSVRRRSPGGFAHGAHPRCRVPLRGPGAAVFRARCACPHHPIGDLPLRLDRAAGEAEKYVRSIQAAAHSRQTAPPGTKPWASPASGTAVPGALPRNVVEELADFLRSLVAEVPGLEPPGATRLLAAHAMKIFGLGPDSEYITAAVQLVFQAGDDGVPIAVGGHEPPK